MSSDFSPLRILLVLRLMSILQLLLNVVEVEANKGGIGWWC